MNTCIVDACQKPVHVKKRGLCQPHYYLLNRYGTTDKPDATNRDCLHCGINFVPHPSKPRQKYCTHECKVSAARKREAQATAKVRARIVRECPQCGEQFSPEKKASQKYCSQRCGRKASRENSSNPCTEEECDKPSRARGLCSTHYNNAYQKDRHARVTTQCSFCGKQMQRIKSISAKRRPACSEACKKALQYPPKCDLPEDHWARWYGKASAWPRYPLTECRGCGETFAPERANVDCCTDKCARAKKLLDTGRMPEAMMATVPKACEDCGGTYTSPYVGQTRCKPCKRKLRRGRWITDRRRHAIYQRDKYVCHLCGGKTDYAAHYLDKAYPTLDHLVPRSKGGSDEDYNLACCHRGCNTQRGVDELPILQLA